ncbi:helix-turn-helix domain-containing protein [Mesorhizobium sp. M7A.F.Ca.US.008.03.1.1]|uniref:helix-turn-helix domain-containing protein n=1 Tax=Mesorhizobium sp. M7A.F.Ca.US.008.03.1.1 TaxID=2496742 RepID=UPI000FC9C0D5|nr:helix-turn-helix domain-containing protein [Mesorhizobium sp. M7A.F.Ca.US.008.03.1.1]RUW62129.1 DNA-binding protein [Mesorhizobium sp. M7A.F.Ca.US.008.03.1.1]
MSEIERARCSLQAAIKATEVALNTLVDQLHALDATDQLKSVEHEWETLPEWAHQPEFLTPKQAGHLARRHETTILRWCENGFIGTNTRVGGRHRITKRELFEYLAVRNEH